MTAQSRRARVGAAAARRVEVIAAELASELSSFVAMRKLRRTRNTFSCAIGCCPPSGAAAAADIGSSPPVRALSRRFREIDKE